MPEIDAKKRGAGLKSQKFKFKGENP